MALMPVCAIAQEGQRIYGKITDGFDPLQGVAVGVKGTSTEVFSDAGGMYEIFASPRDELVFSRAGMDTLHIVVEDVTSRLNIEMRRQVQELDEVVVTESKISMQKQLAMDYFTKPSIINTSFGYLDNEKSAYHFYVIDGEKINLAAPDIVSVIAARIPGARVRSNSTGERVVSFRGGAGSVSLMSQPVYEIDGVLYTDTPTWLPLNNILRIGVIPGLQAVWRYGAIATGGLVIINTRNSVHGLREEGSLERYDQARLRHNLASDNYLTPEDAAKSAPTYLVELANAQSESQAVDVIEGYAGAFSGDPNFWVECYKSLFEKWGPEPADSLLDSHGERFYSNPIYLRTLAFTYEHQRRPEKAHELYKQVLLLRPDYAQSYIDLANSYYGIGDHSKAYALLLRYLNLVDGDLVARDTVDLPVLLDNELVAVASVSGNLRTQSESVEPEGTRLFFTWSDAEAEFELQFVNPGNQYYNWKHSLQNDAARIYREKVHGYTSQEYLMDDSLPGQWQVRCTYYGNKKLSPTYLKMYIYRDFGQPSQTREVRTFRLDLKDVSRQLLTFSIGPKGVKLR
ncbi:carboxypeptidase-like regulatory domain-containing protein [Robiginitalea sp. SC105]|uniref:carboxypeptidase-like regulatory domain-containing protein n=1 Tax=Robiginitalea sp. SC105 TaxID=2762332 RepID=UPI0016399E13|nr:carboxypeptidase-like regulatory domain-containing protein [Robiginitalea sp. SC105]MBC2840065.1 carboxypeptidase-like regulatory domain-containing protein [Robiginitalea sp. SC105]